MSCPVIALMQHKIARNANAGMQADDGGTQMLIIFKTPAHANVTMFGDVALSLIESMGHSTTVPSALMPAEIPRALKNLRKYVAESQVTEDQAPEEDSDGDPVVSIRHRAQPLIELLEAAMREDKTVLWEQG
jgi:hypothetical protein